MHGIDQLDRAVVSVRQALAAMQATTGDVVPSHDQVLRAMRLGLEPAMRIVITLVDMEGLTEAEAATVLNMKPAEVAEQLRQAHRAVHQLVCAENIAEVVRQLYCLLAEQDGAEAGEIEPLELVAEIHQAYTAAKQAVEETLRVDLDEAVRLAREQGVSWTKLAKRLGMTTTQAQQRWDPRVRERNRVYLKERHQGRVSS